MAATSSEKVESDPLKVQVEDLLNAPECKQLFLIDKDDRETEEVKHRILANCQSIFGVNHSAVDSRENGVLGMTNDNLAQITHVRRVTGSIEHGLGNNPRNLSTTLIALAELLKKGTTEDAILNQLRATYTLGCANSQNEADLTIQDLYLNHSRLLIWLAGKIYRNKIQ